MKKYIFPSAALAGSLYFSAILAAGMIVGYTASEIFVRKYIKTGRIKSMVFKRGDWRFHIHHWVSGTVALFLAALLSLPAIGLGFFGGMICHDLHTDKTWHKVIYRKK